MVAFTEVSTGDPVICHCHDVPGAGCHRVAAVVVVGKIDNIKAIAPMTTPARRNMAILNS
jgi:hypothetical protein